MTQSNKLSLNNVGRKLKPLKEVARKNAKAKSGERRARTNENTGGSRTSVDITKGTGHIQFLFRNQEQDVSKQLRSLIISIVSQYIPFNTTDVRIIVSNVFELSLDHRTISRELTKAAKGYRVTAASTNAEGNQRSCSRLKRIRETPEQTNLRRIANFNEKDLIAEMEKWDDMEGVASSLSKLLRW